MMSDCEFSNLGHQGPNFTWHKYIHGVCYLAKRLDKALASLDWQTSFPEAYVETFCRIHSDHNPIILPWEIARLTCERSFRLRQPGLPFQIIRILFVVLRIEVAIMS